MFNVSPAAAAGERGVRPYTMSNAIPFCDKICVADEVIVNPGMDDLRRVVDRMRSSRELSLSLIRTSDMDSDLGLIRTDQGIAVFGCEDLLRGNFGFYFYDAAKPSKLFQVEIYEVPRYAFCEKLDHAIQIAETFFREGELHRQFSWMIDVSDVRGVMKRGNLLAAGNELPLEAFVARVAQQTG